MDLVIFSQWRRIKPKTLSMTDKYCAPQPLAPYYLISSVFSLRRQLQTILSRIAAPAWSCQGTWAHSVLLSPLYRVGAFSPLRRQLQCHSLGRPSWPTSPNPFSGWLPFCYQKSPVNFLPVVISNLLSLSYCLAPQQSTFLSRFVHHIVFFLAQSSSLINIGHLSNGPHESGWY